MSTGIKDVDLEIMLKLEDLDLMKMCEVNKYFYKLGKNENLWRKKVFKVFAKQNNDYFLNNKVDSWRRLYIDISKDVREAKSHSLATIFNKLDWYVTDPIPKDLYIYFLIISDENVIFHFPLDSYILHHIEFTINSPTPYKILNKIKELANSSITMKDYEKLLDLGDSAVENFSLEDIKDGKIKYYSIVGKHFSGFYNHEKGYVALLDF